MNFLELSLAGAAPGHLGEGTHLRRIDHHDRQ
jgi:hypothetical protein